MAATPVIPPDSLGSSPRWKVYPTGADVDFVTDGGGPVRAIRSDADATLVLTPVAPINGTTTQSTLFKAGETQHIQARDFKTAGSTAGVSFTAYW